MPVNKVVASVEEAIADVGNGAVIAIPGFFAAGVPRVLLQALIAKRVKNLTLTCGCGPLLGASEELGRLVENGQVAKVIDSYPLYRSASKGIAHPFEQAVRRGEIELEVYPMGTLAEKYRSAGAGIPAFYTPTGVGSIVQEAVVSNLPERKAIRKETRVFDGREYILEYALRPDFAFVHAFTADVEGNLRYRKTARNFNHVMATAARVTIAEAESIAEAGGLDPDDTHTPGVYVQRVVRVPRVSFRISID